jgi:hypothetical protein
MRELLALAAAQYGLFTRAQANRCGVNDKALEYRKSTGVFAQLARHVFQVAGTGRTWEQRVLAACLAGGDRCVASHRTAAALWHFDTYRPGQVEVTVPRDNRFRTQLAIVHQSLDLVPKDVAKIGPIPITTPTRTLIDLGAVNHWRRVEDAFDSAEREAQIRRQGVSNRHSEIRKRGRRGVGPMAVVLTDRPESTPDSVLERRFLRLLDDANLPPPICQYEVTLGNGRTAFIDAAHVAPKCAWELDGRKGHASDERRALDNVRTSALQALGWNVERFTYNQVKYEGASVVRIVRDVLARRSCDVSPE